MTESETKLDQPDEVGLELDDQALEAPDPAWNLQERHAAIMRSLAKVGVDVTGQNRFRRPALSIEDVDVLLERLMGRYGVVSDYEFAMDDESRPLVKCITLEKAEDDGVYERWEVAVVSIIRDSRPEREREEERRILFDVGSNPSAAVSFALKRHKRELYHLGAIKEGVSDESASRQRGPRRRDLKGVACPLCGVVGALGWSSRKNMYYCGKSEGGCGEEFPDLTTAKAGGMSIEREAAFDHLVAIGDSVGVVGSRKVAGAAFWPAAKIKARIKLLGGSNNTFERMTDAEWAKGVLAVKSEIIADHARSCGANCTHRAELAQRALVADRNSGNPDSKYLPEEAYP